MIVYADSSVLGRAYLRDEQGHEDALDLLTDLDIALVTGSWTTVELAGAIVRATRSGRGDGAELLSLLDGDVSDHGPVLVVRADQREVELMASDIVRNHGLRAMGAWHVATAVLTLPALAEHGEEMAFASRDQEQAAAAQSLGLRLI